jgi:hypothetical protein
VRPVLIALGQLSMDSRTQRWKAATAASCSEQPDKGPDLGAVKNATGIRCRLVDSGRPKHAAHPSQNVRKALVVRDHTYVMAEGRIAVEGPPDGVSGREEFLHAFLGM